MVGVTVGKAGQVKAHVRVAAAPGVDVSVQANEAVVTALPRVQLRLIVPAVVAVLNVPFAGVVVGAAKDAAPAPVIAQAETTALPVPTAPELTIAIVDVATPALPAGRDTPSAVVGV